VIGSGNRSSPEVVALGVVPARAVLHASIPAALSDAEARLDALYRSVCEDLGGRRLPASLIGRAFVFPDVDAAVAFCHRVQLEALDLQWPEELLEHPQCATVEEDDLLVWCGLRIAMAVDVVRPDEVGLHLLARLAASTPPGRVRLSFRAIDSFSGDRTDLGPHALPGLRGTRRVFDAPIPGLSRGVESVAISPWPEPRDALIGRDGDLAALEELSALGMRVVCVSGDPGVGKTRLLRRFTRDKARRGARVLAVDVAHAVDDWDVITALAGALCVPVREARGRDQVLDRIAAAVLDMPGMLFVVDHADAPFAVEVLRDIVLRAPSSRWLVGGPQRIGAVAEVGYVVSPLLEGEHAGRLYDLAARRSNPRYVGAVGGEVHAIAEELGGNPLAIRIAASSLAQIRPIALFDQLAAKRGDPLRVLDVAIEVLSERHIDTLYALSVFRGPFNVDAAVAVSGCTIDLLEDLHHCGLLEHREPLFAPGALFSHLHRRIREALQKRSPVEHERVLRLAEWLAARCDDWVAQLWSDRAEAVLARLSLERETLRAVIEHLQDRPRLSASELTVLAALLEGAVVLGRWEDAVGPLLPALERALQAVGMCLDADPMVAVKLFRVRGMARAALGRNAPALADLQRAVSLAERWSESTELAAAKLHIGRIHLAEGRYDQAVGPLEEAVDGFEVGAERERAADARVSLAFASAMTGDFTSASAELEVAALDCEQGALWLVASISQARAVVQRRARQYEAARASLQAALDIWTAIGRWDDAALVRVQLALLLQGRGALDDSVALLAEADLIARRWGDSARRGIVLTHLGLAQLERGDRAAAHKTFIRAVSACRAGGDRAGQGAARGFLGLLHQLSGRLEEAHDAFREALRDLESGGDRRYGPLFQSCLGAVEAARGNLEEARILVDLAQLQLNDADAGLRAAMVVFHRAIGLAEADAHEANGEIDRARELRAAAANTLQELSDAEGMNDIYLRFARSHLATLLGDRA
jgi:tetratricopeptide (TPR) repeat protein